MKHILLILLVATAPLYAQQGPQDLHSYFSPMGGHNPSEAVSIVCFSSAEITPDELTKFEHKTISVTGKVKLYHGKTEIILTSLDQISEH